MILIDSTENVQIYEVRACGNTERIVDNTIQLLFKGVTVNLIDHVDNPYTKVELLKRIKIRLEALHMEVDRLLDVKKVKNNIHIKLKR